MSDIFDHALDAAESEMNEWEGANVWCNREQEENSDSRKAAYRFERYLNNMEEDK